MRRDLHLIHAAISKILDLIFKVEQRVQDEKRHKEEAEKQTKAEKDRLETDAAEKAKKEVRKGGNIVLEANILK